jgi:ion channel
VIVDVLLFIAGLVLALLTLSDVFQTVVVPGGSHAFLQVARRIVWALLPLWKYGRGRRRGLSDMFGPLALVLSFVVWICLLTVSFGLMVFALRSDFRPPLTNLGDALYLVGSTLATVGLSESNPLGAARWIILAAGFGGLGVMTLAVTYLLEVQSSIAKRDTGIIKLNTSAGEPPSAVTLLERFAAIGNRDELAQTLHEGRNWCATVRQSHSSHPSLIYFQGVSTQMGWPAALGALLDLALLAERCLDEKSLHGPAILLRAEGTRMAKELAESIGLRPMTIAPDEAETKEAARRLKRFGYPIIGDPDFATIARDRSDYRRYVDPLAQHLGKPTAVLAREA